MFETRHLDLGGGMNPRNPYNRNVLYCIDLQAADQSCLPPQVIYCRQDFVIHPLPFESNFFDSLSAFDVLEHVPRQLLSGDGELIYPFINLMNEVYRVLKPGGLLLAATPAYPHPDAFQDPTHVNFMTNKTVGYFSGDKPFARMYGFNGNFNVHVNKFGVRKNYYTRRAPSFEASLRHFYRKFFKGGLPHLIWELSAEKSFVT